MSQVLRSAMSVLMVPFQHLRVLVRVKSAKKGSFLQRHLALALPALLASTRRRRCRLLVPIALRASIPKTFRLHFAKCAEPVRMLRFPASLPVGSARRDTRPTPIAPDVTRASPEPLRVHQVSLNASYVLQVLIPINQIPLHACFVLMEPILEDREI